MKLHHSQLKNGKKYLNSLEDSKRQSFDRDIFALEYLNTTLNYLIAPDAEYRHTLEIQPDAMQEIISKNISEIGFNFIEKIKQMKVECQSTQINKSFQEYGQFINYSNDNLLIRQICKMEDELNQEIEIERQIHSLARRNETKLLKLSKYKLKKIKKVRENYNNRMADQIFKDYRAGLKQKFKQKENAKSTPKQVQSIDQTHNKQKQISNQSEQKVEHPLMMPQVQMAKVEVKKQTQPKKVGRKPKIRVQQNATPIFLIQKNQDFRLPPVAIIQPSFASQADLPIINNIHSQTNKDMQVQSPKVENENVEVRESKKEWMKQKSERHQHVHKYRKIKKMKEEINNEQQYISAKDKKRRQKKKSQLNSLQFQIMNEAKKGRQSKEESNFMNKEGGLSGQKSDENQNSDYIPAFDDKQRVSAENQKVIISSIDRLIKTEELGLHLGIEPTKIKRTYKKKNTQNKIQKELNESQKKRGTKKVKSYPPLQLNLVQKKLQVIQSEQKEYFEEIKQSRIKNEMIEQKEKQKANNEQSVHNIDIELQGIIQEIEIENIQECQAKNNVENEIREIVELNQDQYNRNNQNIAQLIGFEEIDHYLI